MKSLFTKSLMSIALSAALFSNSAYAEGIDRSTLSRKPIDNLVYASSSEPVGFDPHLTNDNESANILVNIYESLLKFKPDSADVEPALAKSWTISDDGLTYTLKLQEGVKFHDGTDFNAQAVKYNIDRQMPGKRLPGMGYADLVYSDVKSSRVIDDHTIEITLKAPSTPFIRNLAMAFAAPVISPAALEKHGNNVMEHPSGTGPYQLVAWDKGQQVVVTTFKDYWGPKPPVHNVIYKVIKDTSARVVALNNGEVDIITGIDANVVDRIEKGGSKVFTVEGNNTNYISFNSRPGFVTADREVRRAIAQAINVPELVKTLYRQYSTPAHSFFPPIVPGYSPDTRTVTYNPDEARKTLADKGVKELTLLTYSDARTYNPAGGQVLAEAIQNYLSKVGVKVNIHAYDWTSYKSRVVTDSWDLSLIGWTGDNGDPDNFINILASKDPQMNQGMWQNPEFIDIIQKAVRLPDGPERIALYQKADAIVAEDVGAFPISHAMTMAAHRPNVEGHIIHPKAVFRFFEVRKK